MYIYVTSTNSLMGQPTHTARMLYLGTNVNDAEKAVGLYVDYHVDGFPNKPLLYSALPEEIEREMIQFYQRSTIWCSIERIEIEEESMPFDVVDFTGFDSGAFYSDEYLTKMFIGMRSLPPHSKTCLWFVESSKCNCILSKIDQDAIRRSF